MKIQEVVAEDGTSGVLDRILTTLQNNLKVEYDKGRIKGTEYSRLLLGTYDAALAQSITYILNKDMNMATTAKIKQETANLETVNLLTLAQIRKIDAEIALMEDDLFNKDAKRALILANVDKVKKDTLLVCEVIETEKLKHEGIKAETKLKVLAQSKAASDNLIAKELVKQAVSGTIVAEKEAVISGIKVDLVAQELVNTKLKSELAIEQIGIAKTDGILKKKGVELADLSIVKAGVDITSATKDVELKESELLIKDVQRRGLEKDVLIKHEAIATEKAKAELTAAQRDHTNKQGALVGLEIKYFDVGITLKKAQIGKVNIDIDNVRKGIELQDSELRTKEVQRRLLEQDILVKIQSIATEKAKAELTAAQRDHTRKQSELVELQVKHYGLDVKLKEAQISKMNADVLIAREQIQVAKAEVKVKEAEIEVKKAEILIKQAMAKKTAAEVDLLNAKSVTEKLQPLVATAQIRVYENQASGFIWDANIRNNKIAADLAAVDASSTGIAVAQITNSAYAGYRADIGIAQDVSLTKYKQYRKEAVLYVDGVQQQ